MIDLPTPEEITQQEADAKAAESFAKDIEEVYKKHNMRIIPQLAIEKTPK